MIPDFPFSFSHPVQHLIPVVVDGIGSTWIDDGTNQSGKSDLVQLIRILPLQLSCQIEIRLLTLQVSDLSTHQICRFRRAGLDACLHAHKGSFRDSVIP